MSSTFSLWVIILIEGFVTLSSEILTMRQLIPFVGNSVIVTSIIIGIFLLFLAYGYLVGGKHTDNLKYRLRNNFIYASIFIGIGISYPFLNLFFYIAKTFDIHLLVALGLYLLLVTSPLVYFLGQTVPITVNLIKSNVSKGEISGKVLHINTVGSFFGSTLTTILLMNYLGVAWTVMISAVLLIFLAILLTEKEEMKISTLNSIALFSLAFSYVINVDTENSTFVKTNSYSNYQVLKDAKMYAMQGNLLIANNSASSFVENDTNKGFPYVESIKSVINSQLPSSNRDVLVLGAGAFSLTNTEDMQGNFTYVDIDKDILAISRDKLGANVKHKFVVDDARSFLIKNEKKYDSIILDTYNSTIIMPSHLLTREYYDSVKSHLKEDGIAVLNVISDPALRDPFSKRLDNTIRSSFDSCMSHPVSYDKIPANIIYVCFNNSLDTNEVYTDNKNTALTDNIALLK